MADRKISQLNPLNDPATGDEFLVLDASVTADADKNKKVQFGTLCANVPVGSVTAPSLGFAGDSDATGFFRSAEDEIAISVSDTLNSKFTSAGFQVGSGTAAATFHTFNATTGDDVVIENTNAGATEGPNFVLYRNSASPAAADIIGTVEFRGEDVGGGAQSYAEITASIIDATAGSEDGLIDFIATTAGSPSSIVRLQQNRVGINEVAPDAPVHVTSTDAEIVLLECPTNDAASGADIRMYRHRNTAVGQDNDTLSTIFFQGNNDNGTASQRPVDYAAIQGGIIDATDSSEDAKILLQVQTAGALTTQLEINSNKIGFFSATAAVQSTHVADITTTATTGTLPTASDTNTIANAAAPTNAELLQYCVTLEAKVEALLAFASAHGLMASS